MREHYKYLYEATSAYLNLIACIRDETKKNCTKIRAKSKHTSTTNAIPKHQSTEPTDTIPEPSDDAIEDSDRIVIYENDESCGYVPKKLIMIRFEIGKAISSIL